jgi:DNA-binding MarR family transcriptional regulator
MLSALLKLSDTEHMSDRRAAVGPDLARNAAELRVRMSRLARRLRREDGGHTLTLSQLSALSRLDRLGAATLSELAAEECVRPQSMARTLDALEAAGLAGREPHPTDRRQHVMRLTASGRVVIDQNRTRRDTWLARAMATALSPDERTLLIRAGAVMDRLAEYVDPPAGTDVTGSGGTGVSGVGEGGLEAGRIGAGGEDESRRGARDAAVDLHGPDGPRTGA